VYPAIERTILNNWRRCQIEVSTLFPITCCAIISWLSSSFILRLGVVVETDHHFRMRRICNSHFLLVLMRVIQLFQLDIYRGFPVALISSTLCFFWTLFVLQQKSSCEDVSLEGLQRVNSSVTFLRSNDNITTIRVCAL
jgi:hypothetical protein